MRNKEKVVNLLRTLYVKEFDFCINIYTTELINNGKMTTTSVQHIMTNLNSLNELSDIVLLLLYKPLEAHERFALPPVSDFFTKEEEYSAASFIQKKTNNKLPVKFKILAKLTDNDNYLICVSIQEINELKQAGLIRWVQGMQRESIITQTAENEFISHIKFDDKRARAIGDSMIRGDFYPNSLRWHITTDNCEYDVIDDMFVLRSGFIAEIDGQHRDKGSEYALNESPDIIMNMPVILTVGNVSTAQHIINQDEERAPIDKNVVAEYKSNSGNSIVKMIIGNDKLDPVYKWCDTLQGIQTGSGFVLKSVVSETIEKIYCKSKMSRNAEVQVAEWLVDFFNELADIFIDDFSNYKKSRKINRKANYETFVLYIYLSFAVKDDTNWRIALRNILDKIDFDKNNIKLNNVKYINEILKRDGVL